jgi:hypothetical protein
MGSVKVPAGLRALGADLVTLSERYGVDGGQWVDDVVWMAGAASGGEAVLLTYGAGVVGAAAGFRYGLVWPYSGCW